MKREIIDNILCAAFEGGSNYWVDGPVRVKKYPKGAKYASDVPSRGGVVEIDEWIDNNTTPPIITHRLTKAKIIKGINKAAKLLGLTLERWYDEHDALSADNALQLALFNEIKYG